MIQPGATFFMVGNASERKPHRHVIVSDPQQFPKPVLVVNFTEFYRRDGGWPDPTCVVGPGECFLLTKESCIPYNYAKWTTLEILEKLVAAGKIDLRNDEPVSPGVLRKIREGFGQSDQVSGNMKKLAKAQGFF